MTLRDFGVHRVRLLISSVGLEGMLNVDGDLILPILDVKIRRKMASVWHEFSKEDRLSALVPWSTRPAHNFELVTLTSPASPLFSTEDARMRRQLAELDE
ncbi:hypothetical protein ONS95_007661 [Cadophora gregata]|uniref:uncharacterized protein n=1 Tax=Cadophora gregata TaxID=51156 RepID=UPI0026DCB87C|nr:uncharacterized protein ONS95_007661 [Cadophora gregata]KAK0118779.1 hypothetical protein ONS96_011864 [Cadophora gregata f. sp. sojae]KAK0126040.1 hypothetical protein ONS95_007661 [Cadophora gregata]